MRKIIEAMPCSFCDSGDVVARVQRVDGDKAVCICNNCVVSCVKQLNDTLIEVIDESEAIKATQRRCETFGRSR